mmetsp:Transcript_22288/g.40201  ORF Transcript_22288/g.40201 Transcript_22288/m.40201 type:complete len:203 (-) Transcript_22288:162-770(-)
MGRHFTLKALPQGKESGMNGILQLNIFLIPLFQKVLGIDIVLANGGGFPAEIGARGIDLVESGYFLATLFDVNAGDEQGYAKGSDASALGVFLHDAGRALDQLGDGLGFPVFSIVGLGRLAGLAHQHPVVGTHARVHKARRRRNGLHLGHLIRVHQWTGQFLVRRNHHPVRRTNPQRRPSIGHRIQGIFDLQQLSRPRKRRQ